MPLTPERVWRAILAAELGEGEDPWTAPPDVFSQLAVRPHAEEAPDEETV
jgi:carbon-monoxide dehydrogenase large subunit